MTARKLTSLRLTLFLAGAAIIFLSCSDKGTDPENTPPQILYSQQIQPIFNANCSGSQCHIGGTANGLSLSSYSSLMQGGISGAVVIPGDPQNSIIIKRLEGRIIPQMPFGGDPLSPSQIQLIRDWIAEGAHNN